MVRQKDVVVVDDCVGSKHSLGRHRNDGRCYYRRSLSVDPDGRACAVR